MSAPITIPAHLEPLLALFAAHGASAYPVGGCVRDTLLGLCPHDWDVAVTTPPEETLRLCESAGLRVIPTGLKHGTVTVLLPVSGDLSDREGAYDPVECTTCRTEGGYSDGRHPDAVSFTGRIVDDLSRRDFTVNAMAFAQDADGNLSVLDLFGGQADLQKGLIRCVGDPETRFSEDALRMLRAVRFAVKLGFSIDPATAAAVRALAPTLARISRERVSAELKKILCSPAPERGVRLLGETHLLPHVLPAGAPDLSLVGALSHLPCDLVSRLACLLWSLPADAREGNLAALRLPTATRKAVTAICESADFVPDAAGDIPRAARAWRHRMGTLAYDALAVRRAHIAPSAEGDSARTETDALMVAVRASEAVHDPVTIAELAVSGRDLLALGHQPGKAMQATLERLLAMVLAAPEKNTREILLSAVPPTDRA